MRSERNGLTCVRLFREAFNVRNGAIERWRRPKRIGAGPAMRKRRNCAPALTPEKPWVLRLQEIEAVEKSPKTADLQPE
jgi:hypothetical protein